MRCIVIAASALTASALVARAPTNKAVRPKTVVSENFGFDFAESQVINTPFTILGERRLKTEYIQSYKPQSLLLEGPPYPVFQEVQNKKLLSLTVESGLLDTLADLGLSLSDIEKLLIPIEEAGLLKTAAKNLPIITILLGYLVIEPGPLIIPLLATLLKIPSPLYGLAALGAAGIEALIVADFQAFGIDTGDFGILGLVLVPAAVLSAVLGGVPTAIDTISRLPAPQAKA